MASSSTACAICTYLWYTMNVDFGNSTRDQAELRTIKYLSYGCKKSEVAEMSKFQGRRYEWGEVGNELDNILLVYQLPYL